MTDFVPPLKDMLFNIRHISGIDDVLRLDSYAEFDVDVIEQVVEEAGKFSAEVLAPLNVPGDQNGVRVEDRKVVVAPGFSEAYGQFVENGWQSLPVSQDFGGMGMPDIAGAAAAESWHTACLSFALLPMLTSGAVNALQRHGSERLRQLYIEQLTSGNWSGTMDLTEPQAGSDLAAITTRAVPEGDHYRLFGTKIFITWGDHEIAENIVHLALARLPDAPEGVRGISMFLVPKFLVNDDGSLGERNDIYVASVEHKLGIHASPTCVLNYGDGDGAIGYLVGEENKGLACMFTMMNGARIDVGLQGLAVSERAYQLAVSWAKDRKQGSVPGKEGRVSIINHADVRRMLMTMKASIEAMRSLAYYTAGINDLATHGASDEDRAAANLRLALLTPVVKGWMTEVAQEITSLGVQIHGGMGYVEETGAAQFLRDARILPIYEGTNGIQAMDFVGRKILGDEGRELMRMMGEIQALDAELAGDERLASIRAALAAGLGDLQKVALWLKDNVMKDFNIVGATAHNLMMLAGTLVGGWHMARAALAVTKGAAGDDAVFAEAKLMTTDFYARYLLPRTASYAAAAMGGADAVMGMPEESF
jgi:acyl-CoA dehydrogenase